MTSDRDNAAYIDLLTAFPPRPITSKEEFWATQKIIDALIDKGNLTPDERDYLNVLGTLVYEYEQKQEPVPDICGIELLEALLAEFGLQEENLVPIFEPESITMVTRKMQIQKNQAAINWAKSRLEQIKSIREAKEWKL